MFWGKLRDIPLIDLVDFASSDLKKKRAVAKLFYRAFHEIGFCFIKSQWQNPRLLESAYHAYHWFFNHPLELKMKFERKDLGHQRGWTPPLTEQARGNKYKDFKESFFVGPELNEHHALKAKYPLLYHDNIWPENDLDPKSWFRRTSLFLYNELHSTARHILAVLEAVMKLPPGTLALLTHDAPSVMRALYYPAVRDLSRVVWGGAHTDMNLITILPPANSSGLWIRRRDGKWIEGVAPAGSMIIQCGDMLEYLSGGIFLSAVHEVRALSAGKSRLSFAYFEHMHAETELRPYGHFATKRAVKKYPPIMARVFLENKLKEYKLLK